MFNYTKCHLCGCKGHVKNNCYYFKRMNEQKTMERQRTIPTGEINQPSTSNIFSGFAFMTGEYKQDEHGHKITFLLNSRASDHIINREDLFVNSTEIPSKISVAKNYKFISAAKRGNLHVTTNLGIKGVLEDVLFCHEVPYNFLSVTKMQRAGLKVIYDQQSGRICKNGKTVMRGQ